MVYMFQPYLQRYFSRWWECMHVFFEQKLPFAIVGGSEPDYSFKQDQKIVEAMGGKIVIPALKSPYPLSLEGASKCHHIIVGQGGPGNREKGMLSAKLELLAADIHLIGK